MPKTQGEVYAELKDYLFESAIDGAKTVDLEIVWKQFGYPQDMLEPITRMLVARNYLVEGTTVHVDRSQMWVVSDGTRILCTTHDLQIAQMKARQFSEQEYRLIYIAFAQGMRASVYPMASYFRGEYTLLVQNTDASKFDPTAEGH